MHSSDADLDHRYHDLLGDGGDVEMFRLVHDLDRALHEVEAPARLQAVLPPLIVTPLAQRHRLWHRRGFVFLGAALILLGVTVAIAAGAIVNLGKPANIVSTNPYFPLSGFHRVSAELHQGKKPVFLFLGVQGPADRVSIERWPLVKALEQFGRFSGARAVDGNCIKMSGGTADACTVPTFDLSHARYTSQYIAFVNRDLSRMSGETPVLYQRLTPAEDKIYRAYSRARQKPTCVVMDSHGNPVHDKNGRLKMRTCTRPIDYITATISSTTQRTLPLLLIGHYLQTSSAVMNVDDFQRTIMLTVLPDIPAYQQSYQTAYSFDTVQAALLSGRNPDTNSHLIEDVNAEANIITALICHADGNRPAQVCSRQPIPQILKHVK